MAIVFNGTTLNWYTHTITFDGSTVSSPNDPGTVTFDGTTVHGLTGFSSETTIMTGGLAPDSSDIENMVPTFQSLDAFHSQGYTQGPGTDTRYRVYVKEGYRVVSSDGTFVGTASPGTSVEFYSGQSVTGINTSHNGGTSFTVRRDNGI
jgi:hypothetical protein